MRVDNGVAVVDRHRNSHNWSDSGHILAAPSMDVAYNMDRNMWRERKCS